MLKETLEIPVAHIDDKEAVAGLIAALQDLHGADYQFAVGRWSGQTTIHPQSGRVIYRFIIEAEAATIALRPGELVRGPAPDGAYEMLDDPIAQVATSTLEHLWPGDAVCVDESADEGVVLNGQGTYFEVIAEQTGYRAPRLSLLRHLSDHPGGCAAYPGAFRRETLPPVKAAPGATDQRGPNRVNEHTLDMRIDRNPTPIRHSHGPIAIGPEQLVNHSETAIVLPRSVYDLPEVDQPDQGHIRIYRRPAEDISDQVVIPVRPGSIVVTPATTEQVMGHCFENCFAMLLAIPGFVAPYNFIDEG